MAARSKATAVTSTAVEIHRVEKPGGILAIYERHDDGTVTRRVEKGLRLADTPDVEGGDDA